MAHITGIRQDGHGVSLELVYKPDAILPFVDIVLVPGLGRTSRETWTTEEPLSCFWPDWLRDSGSLRMARVWTAAVDYAAYAEMNLLERPAETIDTVVEAFRHRLAHDVGSRLCRADARLITSCAECLGWSTNTRRFRSPLIGRHRGQAGKRALCA